VFILQRPNEGRTVNRDAGGEGEVAKHAAIVGVEQEGVPCVASTRCPSWRLRWA
jgi:hypothetical protein